MTHSRPLLALAVVAGGAAGGGAVAAGVAAQAGAPISSTTASASSGRLWVMADPLCRRTAGWHRAPPEYSPRNGASGRY